MTRAQMKRSERNLEKEHKAERQDSLAQRKSSVKVSKGLIAAEEYDGNQASHASSVDSRGINLQELRRDVNLRGLRRGVIYLRVSSEAQDGEDKVSLAEQRAACYEYCEKEGIEIIEVFCDIAPGRTKARPEFQRMLSEIRKGGIDVIVCWKGDRLARSVSPANALLEALEGTDTQLEAVLERIDRNFFVLMAWFGGMELENLKDRTIMGKRGRAKNGMIPCRQICFGYDVDEDGYPILDREAAETVRYIFRLYVEDGLGMVAVTKRLNLEGITSSRGGRWGYGMVNTVLSHPAYMGTWTYGRTRHEHFDNRVKRSLQPEQNWIQIKVPQIIDQHTWERAQRLKKERLTRAKRNTKIFYLLQHRMYCESCGRMMGCRTERRKRVRKDGKFHTFERQDPLRYYFCHGQQRDGYNCRERLSLPAQAIESAVWSATERIIRNPQEFLSGLEPQSINTDKGRLAT